MLGEAPAVIWHLGGVGPVVVATDEDDSHPAAISAMAARIESNRRPSCETRDASGTRGVDKRVRYIGLSSTAASFARCIECATA